jgi:NAD-dependent deacetylase
MRPMPARTLGEIAPAGRYTRIVALTGAGISASAGLGTFRGAGGLWTAAPELERAMHAQYLPDSLELVWQVWGGLRRAALQAGPTPAHRALARAGTTVITQNVDGMHQDAGSAGVLEVHGSAARARCLDGGCGWRGDNPGLAPGVLPRCPRCGRFARPDIVLFGEPLDPQVWSAAERAATSCELFLAIGTSAFVTPAKWLAPMARQAGALCVNVNIDDSLPAFSAFHEQVTADADSALGEWLVSSGGADG